VRRFRESREPGLVIHVLWVVRVARNEVWPDDHAFERLMVAVLFKISTKELLFFGSVDTAQELSARSDSSERITDDCRSAGKQRQTPADGLVGGGPRRLSS